MKESEKCLDPQLWHAFAGGMVQMPPANSLVYYFPQGQAEHAYGNVDFSSFPCLPPYILCGIAAIKYLADPVTDEVYAMMKLVPVRSDQLDSAGEGLGGLGSNGSEAPEKSTFFAKTLTQSDANNGGGFSVPRYCAETIFPRLDYSADPPVQTILAKDVHGVAWKFRHIYRGTPRRHLLTTGWSTFVNQKKLVAGDSIVFLRAENGELCVGIRRAKRGFSGGLESPAGWSATSGSCVAPYEGFSAFFREQENKMMRCNGNGANPNSGGGTRARGKVRPESVVEAATLAAKGHPFEVVYYPRASTPEFCVKAAAVRTALMIDWCPGMRFKMAFETEDSSRISWFMGTISSVQCADPVRWPNSPWRLLQVAWDEPDLLQNVKRVNPWLVELVSHVPNIHLRSLSPPRKKLCFPQLPDFALGGQLLHPVFSGNSLEPSRKPLCCLQDSIPAGIQGARHAQFGISLSDLQISKLHTGLLHAGFHRLENTISPSRISTGLKIGNSTVQENVSCLSTIGNMPYTKKTSYDVKTPHFLLFGQPILTEQQISPSSAVTASPVCTRNSSSDGNTDKTTNISDGSGPAFNQHGLTDNSSSEGFIWYKDRQATEAGLETGHCKVFMQSEDVGRTLDLSVLGSYEELYRRLADMFGIRKLDMKSNVLYHNATGTVKHAGEEAFGDFMKTARRLQILTDAESDNMGGG